MVTKDEDEETGRRQKEREEDAAVMCTFYVQLKTE